MPGPWLLGTNEPGATGQLAHACAAIAALRHDIAHLLRWQVTLDCSPALMWWKCAPGYYGSLRFKVPAHLSIRRDGFKDLGLDWQRRDTSFGVTGSYMGQF